MISIQNSLSLKEMKTFSVTEDSSKKRKWHGEEDFLTGEKNSVAETVEPNLDIDLHLETPLPMEWQRCLDLQSGQIHFYNTRTHEITYRDPRQRPEPKNAPMMSLDLELNLPCESFQAHEEKDQKKNHLDELGLNSNDFCRSKNDGSSWGLPRSLSSVSFEMDHQEMVAAVCVRCHMLVMMCKSSPSCPNCKFMHPPNQNPFSMFKPNSGLLCRRD